MQDWADRIKEELTRYDRRSMVGYIVRDQLLYIASKLRMVRMGWDVWKEQVSEDLCVHGLNRERMYEAIAEWFLDGSDLLSLMSSLALPDTHILTIETENDVIIQFCAHGACY